MRKIYLLVFALLTGSFVHSQTLAPVNCAFDYFIQMKKQNDPAYYEEFAELFEQSKGTLNGNRDGILTVPVVFHIIYNTEAENLPDSVIFSQIDVLNEDYRRQNPDAINTRDIFLDVAADTEIEFKLATMDPDGNPANGITRTLTERDGFSMNLFASTNTLDEAKSSATGGADAWDPSQYLNIWVCRIKPSFIGQVFGMAYPPAGLNNWPAQSEAPTSGVDGVIVHYTTVGRNNPVAGDDNVADNDMGRTLTHEVGHYLGLRHIWGDVLFFGLCDEDDGIEDTPMTGSADNYACNHNVNTCFSEQENDLPDMIENYMDYTKDVCYNMFTQGQKEHMRYVLLEKRNSLLTGNALGVNPNEVETVELSVWPNPAKNFLEVRADMGREVSYTISNLLGKTVAEGLFNDTRIDLSALSSGIYILSLRNSKQWGSQRFVVE